MESSKSDSTDGAPGGDSARRRQEPFNSAHPSQITDPIGKAIRELVELDDINDHISMRVILGRIVEHCAEIADDAGDSPPYDPGAMRHLIAQRIRECANGK